MERQHSDYASVKVEDMLRERRVVPPQDYEKIIKNKSLVQEILRRIRGSEVSKPELDSTIKWLEKVSKYVPIASDKQLEELVKVMVILSKERAKLNELYDKPGLDLMKRVREGMIRYMVVLSELRAERNEYLEYWFTDEYWISEWSRVLLDLAPDNNMIKYGFDDIKARDFLFLLELELATADDASRVEKPMIRLQPIENKDAFLIIPTEVAAEDYRIYVDRIFKGEITFTQWVSDTCITLKIPS